MIFVFHERWQTIIFQYIFSNLLHCVKSVQIGSNFWSVFSRIWTEYGEIWSISLRIQSKCGKIVSLRIQSECGKIRTRNYSVFGHFSRSVVKMKSEDSHGQKTTLTTNRILQNEKISTEFYFLPFFNSRNYLITTAFGERLLMPVTLYRIAQHLYTICR